MTLPFLYFFYKIIICDNTTIVAKVLFSPYFFVDNLADEVNQSIIIRSEL